MSDNRTALSYPIVPLTNKPIPDHVQLTSVEVLCVYEIGEMVLREFFPDVPVDVAACVTRREQIFWPIRSGLVFALAELRRQVEQHESARQLTRYDLPGYAWAAVRAVIRVGANEMAAGVLDEVTVAGQERLICLIQILQGIAEKLGDPIDGSAVTCLN